MGGTWGDDESERKHNQRGFARRESRVKARGGKSGSGPETWAKTEQETTTVDQSRTRGREGVWVELGDREAWECRDGKSTTRGRKKAGGNREAATRTRVDSDVAWESWC